MKSRSRQSSRGLGLALVLALPWPWTSACTTDADPPSGAGDTSTGDGDGDGDGDGEDADADRTPARDALGNVQRIELPPGLSAADCHLPTQFGTQLSPDDRLATADLHRSCRQMKQVQTWLNMLMDPRTWLDSGTQDADDDTRRRWRYFGEYYRADTGGSCDPEAPPKSQSHPSKAFPRMAAVLLASDMPIDRSDVERFEEIGEHDWWWELPAEYAALVDPDGLEATLALRRATMREDVAAWIASAEIEIFAKPGGGGDYDFSAIGLLSFLYLTRDRPELLPEYDGVNLVEKLITHGGTQLPVAWGERFSMPCKSDPSLLDPWTADRWEHSRVFMSGPYFAEIYDSEEAVNGCAFATKAFDSENHVLLQFAYQYLVNQWVAADYHQNLDAAALLGDVIPAKDPDIRGPNDWFVTDGALERELIDALARVVHAGMFETNSRPYEAVSTRAITLLASHADSPRVRAAAENALGFLAVKFAFSSLDGRRWSPMRRNCEYAWRQSLYADDGVAQSIGTLSGAYKWNDSPYGLRQVIDGDPAGCVADPSCHVRDFSFKSLVDPAPNETYADNAGIATAADIDRYVMRSSTPELGALFTSLSRYRLPPAVHEFMFDKHAGYWARMSGRFQQEHYAPPLWFTPESLVPGYFDDALAPFDSGSHQERDPQLWFAGRGYLNVAGGLYNAFYDAPESEIYDYSRAPLASGMLCAGHGAWLGYLQDYGRSDEFSQANGATTVNCTSVARRNPEVGIYDILSRPTTILLEVPREQMGGFEVYRPYGLGSFPVEVAREFLPMMPGHVRTPWKSLNAASFKNVSYGYASACDVDGVCPSNEGGGSALWLPSAWTDPDDSDGDGVIVPSQSVAIGDGNVEFTVYDLREWSAVRGTMPLWLLTADVWKTDADPMVDRASRSFWEVIPERPEWADIDAVLAHAASMDAADFPATPVDEPYVYTTAMSGEQLVLGPRYGSVAPDEDVIPLADRVSGILEARDANGAALDASLQLPLDDLIAMDAMPLLEILAVDSDYAFIDDSSSSPEAYACARDGWICVDNRYKWGADAPDPDAAPTYLWIDARPVAGAWAPRWEWGHYDASENWSCGCQAGFVPGPPTSAVVEACSDPQQCSIDAWPQ